MGKLKPTEIMQKEVIDALLISGMAAIATLVVICLTRKLWFKLKIYLIHRKIQNLELENDRKQQAIEDLEMKVLEAKAAKP